MARNKYPEQTVEKIIEVSLRLFLERGYDHTTVQDIVDHLGGLTKGAVYHHFKSKEEIFEAVLDHMFRFKDEQVGAIMRDKRLNGREKLRCMIADSLGDPAQDQLFSIAPNMGTNTRFLGAQILQVREVSRAYIEPVIREGIADGSIQADQPAELAEMFLFLINFWLNPLVFQMDAAQVAEKCRFCRNWLRLYGLEELLGDEDIVHLQRYCELAAQRKK
ncbi:TetR/AcrR family transcriptional regulator [Agathobaculum sp.]|uniref:TetR/AcrR family transcriptional regulator n=1 Tax=Agathobaculum sp. TaxID=2048138 RepID=UPI002A835614|nr:TetR/AcrR family transcriptional regulator [Agathobaculum sp.]MDY3618742.1 TetR/AcrR family transcriptional regulator [Agathobaculum sp.]